MMFFISFCIEFEKNKQTSNSGELIKIIEDLTEKLDKKKAECLKYQDELTSVQDINRTVEEKFSAESKKFGNDYPVNFFFFLLIFSNIIIICDSLCIFFSPLPSNTLHPLVSVISEIYSLKFKMSKNLNMQNVIIFRK